MGKKKTGRKLIAKNKTAYRNYFIDETIQAGIQLVGTEVKSLRAGKGSLNESFVRIENGEAFLVNAHIAPYEQGNIFNVNPTRKRRLLLHKKQLRKLEEDMAKDGYTIVPISLYFQDSLVKLDIGAGKGKKLYDKRDDLAKKDAQRDINRAFREHNK